jgi:hypothetical protein
MRMCGDGQNSERRNLMPSKIQMVSIELAQATGLDFECARRATVDDWKAVDPILRKWDGDRPEKVDFSIRFEDGEVMTGTIQIGPLADDEPYHRPFQAVATGGLHMLMSLDPEREAFRKFIDKTGEKRLDAITIGAKYDFGCDTSEPAVADMTILEDYVNADTEGRDAGITLAGREDTPTIVFADGQHLMTDSAAVANYLLRQWRIMNNIHPVIGGETALIEEPKASAFNL